MFFVTICEQLYRIIDFVLILLIHGMNKSKYPPQKSIMRTKVIFLISIFLLFIACSKKEDTNNTAKNIIVGGLYYPYTGIVTSSTNTTINISDTIYHFNRIEAGYYSYKPTANQNFFIMTFIDTLDSKGIPVQLEIFTRPMNPADFFQKSSFTIDSVILANTNVSDNFFNANAILKWDTASFENFSFKGKGYFEIIDTLHSKIIPSRFYPDQRINFEFK
jgi:hypothetical protein